MSAPGVLIASLLLGAAALLWPGRRGARPIYISPGRRGSAACDGGPTAGSRVGRDRAGLRGGTGRSWPADFDGAGRAGPALRAVWHEDPVELLRRWRLRRRPEQLVDSVLDLLDGIRPALESGLAPARAVEIAATSSMGPDVLRRATSSSTRASQLQRREIERLVTSLLAAAAAGEEMSSVWADAAHRSRSSELGFVAAAWRLSESTGAPLAAAVDRAAHGLRDAKGRRRKVGVAVAGPKATVSVLTALPLTGPLFGLACGVDPVSMYFGTGLSIASLVVGIGLMVLGRAWCLRIVRLAVAA